MKNSNITKLAIIVMGLLGSNKSSAISPESFDLSECTDCADLSLELETQNIEFDKTYLYTDQTMTKGAISFLKKQQIPFGVQHLGNGQTTISIKNQHEILLSTQRWGSSPE